MSVTPYGLSTVLKYAVVAVGLLICTFVFLPAGVVRFVISGIIIILSALVLNFFRDPNRTIPQGECVVVSPADGRVVLIKELLEPEYLHQEAIQVSIFMSPLDVHVNRFPISGTVEYFKHIPGTYIVASDDKSSSANERTHIGVGADGYRLLFKQVAGAVARRIVADVSVGTQALRGERFGMIKFGSRVDVIMPKHTSIHVSLNDRVAAGESIIATYSPEAHASAAG